MRTSINLLQLVNNLHEFNQLFIIAWTVGAVNQALLALFWLLYLFCIPFFNVAVLMLHNKYYNYNIISYANCILFWEL